MKIIYISIVFILLFYSYSFAQNIPYKEVAVRIHNIPYDKHIYNCLWKSDLFCEFLKSKGIEAKVIIGRFKNERFYRHAYIEYFNNGVWKVIDLTDKPRTWGWERKYYHWLKEAK